MPDEHDDTAGQDDTADQGTAGRDPAPVWPPLLREPDASPAPPATGWAPPPPGWQGPTPPPYYGPGFPAPYQPVPARQGRSVLTRVIISTLILAAAVVVAAVIIHNKTTGSTPTAGSVPNYATAVPSPSVAGTPAGYTNFSSAADRFSIAVPNSWKQIDMSSPGAQAAMNEMEQANPSLKSTFAQGALQMAESGMVLMALNPEPNPKGFASNVSVGAKPALGFSSADLQQLAGELPAEVSKLGVTVTGTRTVTLNGNPALRATLTGSFKSPDGTRFTLHQVQYYVVANELLFVITLSGDDPALTTIASTFSTK